MHYPFRGFKEFEKKVENIAGFMADNTHLPAWWGWHWRRFIRERDAGRLKQEFDRQFVSPELLQQLIDEGKCSVDDTIANWVKRSAPGASPTEQECMSEDKIVLAVIVLDNAAILRDFINWHLGIGVEFVVAFDAGSSDGSQDILEHFAKSGILSWSSQPRKNIDGFDPFTDLSKMARDRFGADWILLLDADEFLCVAEADLHGVLQAAKQDELSVVSIPRFNMTGLPPAPGQNCLEALNLRIDRPCDLSPDEMLSGDLSVPQVFAPIAPKTIVRASNFVEYGAGGHTAVCSSGRVGERAELRMLHYPFRSFGEFAKKVETIAGFMAANTHLPQGWGWHWRRYVRLRDAGLLKEDFDKQFVSPELLRQLIDEGKCSVDDTIANWRKRSAPRTNPAQ